MYSSLLNRCLLSFFLLPTDLYAAPKSTSQGLLTISEYQQLLRPLIKPNELVFWEYSVRPYVVPFLQHLNQTHNDQYFKQLSNFVTPSWEEPTPEKPIVYYKADVVEFWFRVSEAMAREVSGELRMLVENAYSENGSDDAFFECERGILRRNPKVKKLWMVVPPEYEYTEVELDPADDENYPVDEWCQRVGVNVGGETFRGLLKQDVNR
jgi:hypothetical protein